MRPLVWLLPLALFASGCGTLKSTMGGKQVPVVYTNVVSLSPGTTEITGGTYARTIVGRTASCNTPDKVLEAPIVMNGVKPDFEKIARIKPDVVVYDKDLFSEQDLAKFKELGIKTYGFGGDTVDAFIDNVYEFGRFTRVETLGSEYVESIDRARSAALAAPPDPPVSTVIVMPGSGTEHYVCGTDGFLADVVKCSGGKLVGPEGKNFVQLNAEWLISTDPEVILSAGAAETFLKDPRFKGLRAIAKNQVYSINSDVILRRGAAVDRLIKRIGQILPVARKEYSK